MIYKSKGIETKQKVLIHLFTASLVLHQEYDSTSDQLLILLRYSFLLSDTPQDNTFLKRNFPNNGDISTQNSNVARYLAPKYSKWISVDPALGEYMSGSDAGCGGIYNHVNLSLYHYGGNNPIRYVDPTGCDDLYYDENGNYLKTSISKTTFVHVPKDGQDSILASIYDFETMTAALYGEGSSNVNLEEMQAIGDVIMNRAKSVGTHPYLIIQSDGQVNGWNPNSKKATLDGRTLNTDNKLVTARKATITTMQGSSRGLSNGAYFWDGEDIKSPKNPHSSVWGYFYTDSAHDIYNTGNKLFPEKTLYFELENGERGGKRGSFTHILDSTNAIGGTIFWKYNEDWKKATGCTGDF